MWVHTHLAVLLAVFMNDQPGSKALDTPIPLTSRLPGVIYGNGRLDAPVKLQAFLDLNCPDSARDWPVLKQLADHYGGQKLLLVINPFPLPYHRNAYTLSHGLYLTNAKKPSQVVKYIDACFAHIGKFTTSATFMENDEFVLGKLATMGHKATGIPAKTFLRQINSYEGDTRSGWKFAARRGVAGTPWYFVNDVDLAASPSYPLDFDSWKHLLDPLINAKTKSKLKVKSTNFQGRP